MSDETKKEIFLTTVLDVKRLVHKTNAELFRDLKVGSKLYLSVPIKYVGSGSSGASYSVYITVTDFYTKKTIQKSFNQIEKLLSNFEFW